MAQITKCEICGLQWDTREPKRPHLYVCAYDGVNVYEQETFDFCSAHCLSVWAEDRA